MCPAGLGFGLRGSEVGLRSFGAGLQRLGSPASQNGPLKSQKINPIIDRQFFNNFILKVTDFWPDAWGPLWAPQTDSKLRTANCDRRRRSMLGRVGLRSFRVGLCGLGVGLRGFGIGLRVFWVWSLVAANCSHHFAKRVHRAVISRRATKTANCSRCYVRPPRSER